jgi:hypothetical protein
MTARGWTHGKLHPEGPVGNNAQGRLRFGNGQHQMQICRVSACHFWDTDNPQGSGQPGGWRRNKGTLNQSWKCMEPAPEERLPHDGFFNALDRFFNALIAQIAPSGRLLSRGRRTGSLANAGAAG